MDPVSHHYLLPAAMPGVLIYLAAAAVVAVWIWMHVRRMRGQKGWRVAFFLGRVLVGWGALSALSQAFQRYLVVFATSWPLWPILLGGALAVELAVALYALERRTISPRVGAVLTALRTALILLVVWMLCQPVRVFEVEKKIERVVAVLLDVSASMRIPDPGMTSAEKVRLGEMFSIRSARRPYRLDETARTLRETREELSAQADWLTSLAQLDPAALSQQLTRRSKDIRKALAKVRETVAAQTNAVVAPLASSALKPDDPARASILAIGPKLAADVQVPLAEAAAAMDTFDPKNPGAAHARLLDAVRRAAGTLTDAEPKVAAVGETLDRIFYDSLPAAARQEIEAAALKPRVDLARGILLQRTRAEGGGGGSNLLERLQARYKVKVYTFASQPAEAGLHGGLGEAAPETNGTAGVRFLQTDIALALEKTLTDTASEQLAGVLLLSDGRHNGGEPVEQSARRLGLQHVPICPVVFGGGQRPPTDAAVASISAPDTVYAGDRMFVSVDVKLDNLAGTNVIVNLLDGTTPVDSKTIAVPADSFRKRVQLADEPKTNGLHSYRVVVQRCPGEVVDSNNECAVPIRVTDDRVKLLVVEGLPRWEFRYLKNLFSGRDKSVRLQYVLFNPEEVAGLPLKPKVPASVARSVDEAEATALPENEAEWMKFDVIVLGDVAPAALGEDAQRALRKFVAERGGTLIVISGRFYMPHAYATSALADLLPVVFTPGDKVLLAGPEKRLRVALTQEGRDSPIMRLAVDAEENAKVWTGMPELYWRHAIRDTKPGASVLAYALPDPPPSFMEARSPHEVPDEEVVRQRRQIERENPLVVTHNYALGRVMFLAFDHTWRLRYRTGDTYHHKFWGQTLRWATADKILFGTSIVRIGTDQSRYTPDARIRVRAKIVRPDFTPVTTARPIVSVTSGSHEVLRKRMQYVPGSAGIYAADLGALPEGEYRASLEAVEAADVGSLPPVACEFGVARALPAELIELAADRGLLGRVAGLTGGLMVEPARVEEAVARFGPPALTRQERREYALWNSWPLLSFIVALGAAEWILRKKTRLP